MQFNERFKICLSVLFVYINILSNFKFVVERNGVVSVVIGSRRLFDYFFFDLAETGRVRFFGERGAALFLSLPSPARTSIGFRRSRVGRGKRARTTRRRMAAGVGEAYIIIHQDPNARRTHPTHCRRRMCPSRTLTRKWHRRQYPSIQFLHRRPGLADSRPFRRGTPYVSFLYPHGQPERYPSALRTFKVSTRVSPASLLSRSIPTLKENTPQNTPLSNVRSPTQTRT